MLLVHLIDQQLHLSQQIEEFGDDALYEDQEHFYPHSEFAEFHMSYPNQELLVLHLYPDFVHQKHLLLML